jgi:uncharacterized protein (DUF1778 family)
MPKKFIVRSRLPLGSSKDARLYCRLLKSEVAEIAAAAAASGKTTSQWIREVLLRATQETEQSQAQSQRALHSFNEGFVD